MFLLQSLGIRQCQITVSRQHINDGLRPLVHAHHIIHTLFFYSLLFSGAESEKYISFLPACRLTKFQNEYDTRRNAFRRGLFCQLVPEMSVVIRIQNRVHGYKMHRYSTGLSAQSWFVSMVQDETIRIYQPALLAKVLPVFNLKFP